MAKKQLPPLSDTQKFTKILYEFEQMTPRSDSFLGLFKSMLDDAHSSADWFRTLATGLRMFLPYNLAVPYGVENGLRLLEALSSRAACAELYRRVKKLNPFSLGMAVGLRFPVAQKRDFLLGGLTDDEKRLYFAAVLWSRSDKHGQLKFEEDSVYGPLARIILDMSISYRYIRIVHDLYQLGWCGPIVKARFQAVMQHPDDPIMLEGEEEAAWEVLSKINEHNPN